jgi:CHAT domain-containing protein
MTTKPRMWWCPTGAVNSLPLHAAGIYTRNSQNAASDYVTSSYVPTLSTLHGILYRQTGGLNAAASPTPAQLLLLASGVPHSGRSPLPNALVEAEAVREVASDVHYINKPGEAMSVQDALASLPEANILHLACHGSQDQSDPLNSGFDLDDGRMTLGQLIGMTLPRAHLAYLSACDSAAIDESRPDESINLAATMLAVGFKSILATMW